MKFFLYVFNLPSPSLTPLVYYSTFLLSDFLGSDKIPLFHLTAEAMTVYTLPDSSYLILFWSKTNLYYFLNVLPLFHFNWWFSADLHLLNSRRQVPGSGR